MQLSDGAQKFQLGQCFNATSLNHLKTVFKLLKFSVFRFSFFSSSACLGNGRCHPRSGQGQAEGGRGMRSCCPGFSEVSLLAGHKPTSKARRPVDPLLLYTVPRPHLPQRPPGGDRKDAPKQRAPFPRVQVKLVCCM